MQKRHNGRPKFRGWRHQFSSDLKIDKNVENLRKHINGKERTKIVCSRGSEQMNIGILADEADRRG